MKVDVTDASILAMICAAYALSRPQGLGHLHYKSGPLSKEELDDIINQAVEFGQFGDDVVVSLDYVKGRACKFTLCKEGDRIIWNLPWYDHTWDAAINLLFTVGLRAQAVDVMRVKGQNPHNPACNCVNCNGG